MTSQGERPPLVVAGLGRALGCSRRGASHLRDGKPCQDAHALATTASEDVPCLFVAVADGHGDDRHDLSQFGAELAVEAAIAEMRSLVAENVAKQSNAVLARIFKADFGRLVGRRWRELVLDNARGRFPNEPPLADPRPILVRYGTTLLAALVVGDLVLLAQLGDGTAFLIRPGVSVPESSFPPEAEPVGVVTSSLCSNDAVQLWRTAALARGDGGLLFLATDGLVNAFPDDEQLFIYARSLGVRIQEYGLEQVAASLPEWLDTCSARGSGDDITLALADLQPAARQPSLSHEEPEHVTGDRTASASGDGGHQPDGEEETG